MGSMFEKISDSVFIEFKKRYGSGSAESLESAIEYLKDSGLSQAQCVLVLITELKVPLVKADTLVFNSSAWAKDAEAILRFRKIFEDTLINFRQ